MRTRSAGFEPANAGVKFQCLTAWRRPIKGDGWTRTINSELPAQCKFAV